MRILLDVLIMWLWTLEQATVTYYLLLDRLRSHNLDEYHESDLEELVSPRFLLDRE